MCLSLGLGVVPYDLWHGRLESIAGRGKHDGNVLRLISVHTMLVCEFVSFIAASVKRVRLSFQLHNLGTIGRLVHFETKPF